MSVTPVYGKKINTVTLEDRTNNVARDIHSRISSSPTHGDHHQPSRQCAVEENLNHSLNSKGERRYIGENHDCFELDSVVSFREEYGIQLDSNPWKNFKRLLCGHQDLPFIVLRNPTRKHTLEYEEMKRCPTLQWISDVLGEIGLTIEDVVIMDICSLLSDDDLDRMNKDSQSTWDAVEKSYTMVEDILELLNPSVVLSCQCITKLGWRERVDGQGRLKTTWAPADNDLARALCSSKKEIRRGATKVIQIGSRSTLCVYGVHPRGLEFDNTMIPELRGAFKDVLVPCMRWFRKDEKKIGAPEAKNLPHINLVVRTKAVGSSAQKAIQVTVKKVDEETSGLRQSPLKS